MSVVLKREEVNRDAYYRAVEKVANMFKEKGESWIDTSRVRVFDTKFLGYNKRKSLKYSVSKNPDLHDQIKGKRNSYTVILNGLFSWCSCEFQKRKILNNPHARLSKCTHIGAALIFKHYLEELSMRSTPEPQGEGVLVKSGDSTPSVVIRTTEETGMNELG